MQARHRKRKSVDREILVNVFYDFIVYSMLVILSFKLHG